MTRNNGAILDFRSAAALIFGGGRAAGSININSSPLPTKKVRYDFHHYKITMSTQAELQDGTISVPVKRGRGRPKKGHEVTVTTHKPQQKSDREVMAQFRTRILRSSSSKRVIESILNAAMDDTHKNQAVAWKLLIDRIAPIRDFEGDQLTGRSSVNITITGVETVNDIKPIEGEVIQDAEIEENA